MRVNVQLINALTDTHLWADTFDRKLTDIFSVEARCKPSPTTCEQNLRVRRSMPSPRTRPRTRKLTMLYLRGLAYTLKTAITPANFLAAQKHLREAVPLD